MKLLDILEQLSQGELRQMAVGGSGKSGITPDKFPKVIPHIQMGLTELHKRFLMNTDVLVIQQMEGITEYFIHTDHAATNSESTAKKYIQDTPFKPFNDNDYFLGIEKVSREDGFDYPLNDETQTWSVYTPSYNSVQVPFNDKENAMFVQFRANHPNLAKDGEGVLDQTVQISPVCLEALLLYVAGRYYSNSDIAESQQAGIVAMTNFERSCQRIKGENLNTVANTGNEKLEINGWV